jgi:pentatricopeptide repeat protein
MLEKITTLIHKSGLVMNINSYEIIIQGLCANSELEHALDILGDMTVSVDEEGQPDENGRPNIDVRPSLQCFVPIIQLAQSLHESETAYLVLKMAEVQAGLSRIPTVVYTDLMAKAAEDYMVR